MKSDEKDKLEEKEKNLINLLSSFQNQNSKLKQEVENLKKELE